MIIIITKDTKAHSTLLEYKNLENNMDLQSTDTNISL